MSHFAGDQFKIHRAVDAIYLMLWYEQYFYYVYFIQCSSEDTKYS